MKPNAFNMGGGDRHKPKVKEKGSLFNEHDCLIILLYWIVLPKLLTFRIEFVHHNITQVNQIYQSFLESLYGRDFPYRCPVRTYI